MIRFYTPDITERGIMSPEESIHCCRVLRLHAGDRIETVDGRGHVYSCTIVDDNPKGVLLEINSIKEERKNWEGKLILAVAPTKNSERMEWLVEKAVEMGIDEIILLKCDHSERKFMKLDRLHKIMISAMKQSLKASATIIRGPVEFEDFIQECKDSDAVKVFGYCSDEVERKEFSSNIFNCGSNLIVMIGPEGDFSPKEVNMALYNGFIPVTFGKSRLRTETASLYAVAAFHLLRAGSSVFVKPGVADCGADFGM